VGVGNFDGDGHADVLWFNANTGVPVEWLLDGRGNVIATPGLSMSAVPGVTPRTPSQPSSCRPGPAGRGCDDF
jgi:hypothetical protein